MTDPHLLDHEAWDALAAGHALHALDAQDVQRFGEHLEGCEHCSAELSSFTVVAAQLGALADDGLEAGPSWADIRRGVVVPATAPTRLRPRRDRRRVAGVLAAAAAVVAIAGGGAVLLQSHRAMTGKLTTVALAACERQVGCRAIKLHGSHGETPAAVLVNGEQVAVVPLDLAAAPPGRTYVLWQMPGDGSPIPVTEFRDTSRQTASTLLPSGRADTAAFAISIEPAGAGPTRPTRVLAVGTAS